MNIGIGTAFSKDAPWLFMGANCLVRINKYCEKFNFSSLYEITDLPDYCPGWIKHVFISKNLSKFDYLLYLDPDAVIENFDFDLSELIAKYPDKDLFLSRDSDGPCAGVMLIKSSDFSKRLFDDLFSYKDLHNVVSGDQDALIRFINLNFSECLSKVKFVDPGLFHLTTWGGATRESALWQRPGSRPFIFHYLGGTISDKQKSLNYPIIRGDRDTFPELFGNKNVVGAEVGVYRCGYSSQCLSKMKGKLCLIDDYTFHGERVDITNTEQSTRDDEYEFTKNLYKDNDSVSIIRKSSLEASRLFPNDFFDYVYIDADHRLEGVRQDMEIWWPKVKTNGLLCGHDYLNETTDSSIIEVKKAVDEFCLNKFPLRGFVSSEEKYKSWYIYKQ